jgi:FkbM family methyltransferase
VRLKKLIRRTLVDRLPIKSRLAIERAYLYHYYGDSYVGREVRLFRQLSNPRKNSLDVGANWGLMTLFLAQCSYRVYCFEPIPWLYEGLEKKFCGCNVSVFGCALGNADGEFPISIPYMGGERVDTRSSLNKDFTSKTIFGEDITRIEKIQVSVRQLDGFNLTNIGFVKIDVEGFEMEVLEGGKLTLRENTPNLVIEIEQRHQDRRSVNDTFKYLKELGYFGYFVYKNGVLRVEEFDVNLMQDQRDEANKERYVNNFIFTQEPRLVLTV